MATYTSKMQIYNILPKRAIHQFIFMWIGWTLLMNTESEDPYTKRCWVTRPGFRYRTAKSTQHRTVQECKDYCQYQLLYCDLIVFDAPSSSVKCAVRKVSTPLDISNFQAVIGNVNTYMLLLDCARNVSNCWTIKGDYDYENLDDFTERATSLEACKSICIYDYPECTLINYGDRAIGGDGCWVKTQGGPLDKFIVTSNMVSYVLNRTCQATHVTNPYTKRCWVTRPGFRYRTAKSTQHRTVQECKDFCQYQLPYCDLIVYDAPSSTVKCAVRNVSTPLEHSNFQAVIGNINTYMLLLDCARNVPSCWTIKGDYDYENLDDFTERATSLKACKSICINVYPECTLINYGDRAIGGDGCWVKTQGGPMDKFIEMPSMVSYVLNRNCQATQFTTARPSTTLPPDPVVHTLNPDMPASPEAPPDQGETSETDETPNTTDATPDKKSPGDPTPPKQKKSVIIFAAIGGIVLVLFEL